MLALSLAEIHADRKGLHEGQVVAPLHGKAFPFDSGFQNRVDGLQKIVAVSLCVKADQIGSEQAVEELALPGADAESFRIGPRNMPEDRDASVGTSLFDHPRQKREMIVLHEQEGMLRILQFIEHGSGELFGWPADSSANPTCERWDECGRYGIAARGLRSRNRNSIRPLLPG